MRYVVSFTLMALQEFICWMHLQGLDGSDLRSDIKKYRQSIFKLNYKIKKSKTNCKARHKIAVPQNAADRVLAHQALDPSAEAA